MYGASRSERAARVSVSGAFTTLQAVVALGALLLVAARARVLLFEARLDAVAFGQAIGHALAGGQRELARTIATECLPAWPARYAQICTGDVSSGVMHRIEELQVEVGEQAARGLDALVTLGRLAMPLALIGVILELGRVTGHTTGLLGLQRGLVLSLALRQAMLDLAFGLATALVCVAGARVLREGARSALADLDRLARSMALHTGVE